MNKQYHTIVELSPSSQGSPFTKVVVSGEEVLSVNVESAWEIDRIFTDLYRDPHGILVVAFKRKEKT